MNQKRHSPFPSGVLEGISKTLGRTVDGLSGPEICKFLGEVGIQDLDSTNTKWKRLYNAFANNQNRLQTSNNILKFITQSMNPARFIGKNEQFEDLRFELNKRLSFVGLELGESGKYRITNCTTTISEAEQKASRLKSKLENRNAHPKIFEYCSSELLAENYFHSVFEAVKSIAETIRQKAKTNKDGAELIDLAFSVKNPLIKINDLRTETEESEQKGFANLVKGVFGMFRNVTAHAPKIVWEIDEQDALDILSTISLIHRKLDQSKK